MGARPPSDPWRHLRIVAFLNHTSLYEPLFVGGFPNAFIRRIAFQGLMPVADKATRRPLMGFFFRMVAKGVVGSIGTGRLQAGSGPGSRIPPGPLQHLP